MTDTALSELVDEFFFEMHVCNHVMRLHGFECVEGGVYPEIKAWYDVAVPARERGIRMHFWP